MKKRDPILTDLADGYTLLCIRRVSLDVCGSRSPRTVRANLNRLVTYFQSADFSFGLPNYLPQLGWPVVEDRVGMVIALVTLNASLRPGKYANHLQYDTMRKTPTWYRNVHTAGIGYNVDTLYAQDEKRVHATSCVTSGEWFVRFKLGAKYRMCQIRQQNEAFTSEIIHALDDVAQDLWDNSLDEAKRKKIEELMAFVIMTYCGNLLGEEVPLVSLLGMKTCWEDSINAPEPYIMLTLHGRFNGENQLRWHCIPIPICTKTSLPVMKWIRRVMRRSVLLEKRSNGYGWLFADEKGRKPKMSHYDPLLIELLEKVKAHFPGVIPASINPSDFSLWRSGRRGGLQPQLVLEYPSLLLTLWAAGGPKKQQREPHQAFPCGRFTPR